MRRMEKFDAQSNSWKPATPLLAGKYCSVRISELCSLERGYLAAAVHGNCIYAVGGRDMRGTALKVMDRLDIRTNRWDTLAPMPTSRQSLAAVSVGDHIYSIGGYDGIDWLDVVERFDVKAGRWENVSCTLRARGQLAAVVVGNCIYSIGGIGDQAQHSR